MVAFDPVKDIPDLTGRVYFVTGGNTGLGKEAIRQLAAHNPSAIYLAARTESKATAAIKEIKEELPSANIQYLELDLSSFESVATAAKKFTSQSDRLDVLLNNAGVMNLPFSTTKEGYEIQMGTNHMGHALLTKLLLPTLLRTAEQPGSDVRVVTLSSSAHQMASFSGGIMYDVKRAERAYTNTRYGTSKLANLLFARELADRYPSITSTSVHPGVIDTQLFEASRNNFARIPVFGKLGYSIASKLIMTSVPEGAKNELWAATADRSLVRQGYYFNPVGKKNNGFRHTGKKEAVELWEWTEKELAKHGY